MWWNAPYGAHIRLTMLIQGTSNGNIGRTESNSNDVVDRIEGRRYHVFGEKVSGEFWVESGVSSYSLAFKAEPGIPGGSLRPLRRGG
jgi:hypothetical protein